tara:strand:- start:1074 stop:2210 length:1137 start_codon:yes stop_codon:yes gene_type:complete
LVKISEFSALIPKEDLIQNFSIKSYPEYSDSELKKELKKNPISYLKILEKNRGKTNFNEIKKKIENFKTNKILIKKKPSIFIYQQLDRDIKYIGIICGISTNDYEQGFIKIHENTLKKRQELFERYLEKCKIHAEPVLLTYKNNKNIQKFIDLTIQNKPKYEFQSNDKIVHKIWEINNRESISTLKKYFQKIKSLYIADGHHRMSSSYSYNKSNGLNNPCLAYIVASDQLKLESFHRVISKSETYEKKLLKFIKTNPHLISQNKILPIKKNEIKIFIKNKWITLITENKDIPVFVLSNLIFKQLLNIKDLSKNDKIKYIPNSKLDLDKLKAENRLIFLLPTINISTIIDTANKNDTMPPKSTYINPKLRTGLIIMELK